MADPVRDQRLDHQVRHTVLQLRKATHHLRKALQLATEITEHHGVESWSEIDPEGGELLSHSVGEVRAVLEELAALPQKLPFNKRPPGERGKGEVDG